MNFTQLRINEQGNQIIDVSTGKIKYDLQLLSNEELNYLKIELTRFHNYEVAAFIYRYIKEKEAKENTFHSLLEVKLYLKNKIEQLNKTNKHLASLQIDDEIMSQQRLNSAFTIQSIISELELILLKL